MTLGVNLHGPEERGADGYLLKDVRGVAQGEVAISGGLAVRFLEEFAGVRPGWEASERYDLTPPGSGRSWSGWKRSLPSVD